MTNDEVAGWMLDTFRARSCLYQDEVASHLYHLHDERLSYFDGSSNLCIGKGVLAAFNTLTPDAVYERAGKFWRWRLSTDQPGRQQ